MMSIIFYAVSEKSSTVSESGSCAGTGSGEQTAAARVELQKVSEASSWLPIANIIAQALIFISSCCNPFIYYLSSPNFREFSALFLTLL